MGNHPIKPVRKMRLEELWLNVTERCNLRCIHCHYDPMCVANYEDVSLGVWQKAVNEFIHLGGKRIVISGGEPLLYPHFLEHLRYLCSFNELESMVVVTNGTLWNEEIAKSITDPRVTVQVSFEGATEGTNDMIRGEGVFKKAVECVKLLVKNNVRTVMRMTLMKTNIHEIKDFYILGSELGAIPATAFLQVKGRAAKSSLRLSLTPEEEIYTTKKAAEAIEETSKKYEWQTKFKMPIMEGGDVPNAFDDKNIIKDDAVSHCRDLCGAASEVLSISGYGDVYPCAGFHIPEFKAGNIKNQNLEQIWSRSPILREFRGQSVLDVPECRNCEIRFICGGGCRVDKYFTSGCMDVPSPRCSVYKEGYMLSFQKMAAKTEELLKSNKKI